jgi:hypothetical protein
MASIPARDPAKSSMDPASANNECPKPCSRWHSPFPFGRRKHIFKAEACLTWARKITVITLIVRKRGVNFDAKHLN